MAHQRILVIGGTGYIGTPLVKKLISDNREVTLLVRNGEDFRNEFRGCKYFVGDLLRKEGLMKNIDDFDLVINLAAIIRALNKKKYRENVQGMENLIEVLQIKGIKKIVYFSTQNVNLKEKGPYGKSKEAAENLLKNSKLEYMIVRPNYVYGIDRFNDFYKMAYFIRHWRIAPVIGNGNYKIQPVLKEDLVNIVFTFVDNFKLSSVIEVSGRETIPVNEVIRLIGENLKIKPLIIHLPVWPLRLFKNFIPFDIDGYTEDRISKTPFLNYNFSSFRDTLKQVLKLL